MPLCNYDLNCYFTHEVQMQRDITAEVRNYIMPIVEKLMTYIHKQDPRFAMEAQGAGSSFQGLKTNAPDEFDFNILLDGLGEFTYIKNKKRFYGFAEDVDDKEVESLPDLTIVKTRVPLPEPPQSYCFVSVNAKDDLAPCWINTTDLTFAGDLIPFLVKQRLKKLLQEAIRSLNLRDKLRLGRRAHGPALVLRIPYNQHGIEEISVDFAPLIPMKLEFPDNSTWPRRKRKWPCSDKIEKVFDIGLDCTAKKSFDWLDSYAACEHELMRDIDKDGGCRKKALRIMKSLRTQFWCTSNKPTLSSYHLKNLLLWECERYPDTSYWQNDRLAERISEMVTKLVKWLSNKKIKQYFDQDVNLLTLNTKHAEDTLEREINNIRLFLDNPAEYLLKHDPEKLNARKTEE